MGESIFIENREPAPQKPPLSVGRIAGEILVGTVVGCAAAELAKCVVVVALRRGDCMGFGG